MRDFWALARLMLLEKRLLVLSILAAFVGAAGLGVGLATLAPVIQNVLDPANARGLPELVGQFNPKVGNIIPQSWIDNLPTGPFNAVFWVVIGLGILAVIGGVANYFHASLSMTVVGRTVSRIRDDVFRHVVRLPLKTVTSAGPSDYVAKIINDTGQIGVGLSGVLSKALSQAAKAFAAIIAAAVMDWRLTLAALPLAFVTYHIVRWTGKKVRRAAKGSLEAYSEMYRSSAEVMQHLRVVKTSTSEQAEFDRFHAINMQALHQDLRVRTIRAIASPLVEILSLVVMGALTLVAVKLILDGHLEKGKFLGVLISLGIAGASVKPLTGLQHELQVSAAAATRLRQVLASEPEPGLDEQLPALPRHARSIRFVNVRLTYPNAAHPALDGINLEVPQGRTVAFVGPNGCGKTSLLSLVPRLFDPDTADSAVLIDGTDIRTVNVRSLRAQVGVVTQETVMFKGTIRDNIAYGVPHATDAQIADAVRKARAEEFINAKTGGMSFMLGEGGSGLSGGQRQRIAIARAILRDPAILILDEATSMIDADSEAKIAEALADFSRGRTCLIVAHRLSTVVHADRIVVMDQGRVADSGTHQELFDRCEVYRLIAQNQLLKPKPPEGP